MRSIENKFKTAAIFAIAFLILGNTSAFAAGKATLRDLAIDAHFMMQGALGTGMPPATSELTLTKADDAALEIGTKIPARVEPKPLLHLNTGLLPATAGMRTSVDDKKE